MKTVAIMQPTYLPWIGYFAMIRRADVFVFLDSVQFAKRSWQQRNQIKTAQGATMLTVPVFSKGKREQLICEVEIDWSSRFAAKHCRSIESAYAKAAHFGHYAPGLLEHISGQKSDLATYNIALIEWLMRQFSIETPLLRSSQMELSQDLRQADLLLAICRQLNADCYLSAPGSRAYIEEGGAFAAAALPVTYHEYAHPVYPQLHGEFLPYMSAVDLLMNVGQQAAEVMMAGVHA